MWREKYDIEIATDQPGIIHTALKLFDFSTTIKVFEQSFATLTNDRENFILSNTADLRTTRSKVAKSSVNRKKFD